MIAMPTDERDFYKMIEKKATMKKGDIRSF